MFSNLETAVQAIADGLTLKADYSEELERLDGIDGDIAVMRRMGVPVWKCVALREKIKDLRNWMLEEMAHNAN